MLEDLIIAVPGDGDTVVLLKARLEELGLVGWAIDGTRLGHGGWVLARVSADDEGALAIDADGDLGLLEIDDLRASLLEDWPDAQVSEIDLGEESLDSAETRDVAVTSPANLVLSIAASMTESAIAEARIGDHLLVGRVRPAADGGEGLAAALASAKGTSTVLWREVGMTGVLVLRRGKVVAAHTWQPTWLPVGGAAQDDLRQALQWGQGDAAEIAKVLGLSPDLVLNLRALMRRESPSLEELCELLNLPEEALRVVSGECAVTDLPHVIVHEPKKMTAAVRESMKPSDDDPTWVRWIEEGQRELKWWYLVWCVGGLWLFGAMVVRWLNGGSPYWGVLGATCVMLMLMNLNRRWRAKRRRAA